MYEIDSTLGFFLKQNVIYMIFKGKNLAINTLLLQIYFNYLLFFIIIHFIQQTFFDLFFQLNNT